MDNIMAYLICFALCALTAYMDIYTFFSKKRISVVSILSVLSADAFILLNGLLGLAILAWALMDLQAKINTVLSFESAVGKGLIIGFSIPMIIRSKWFSLTTKDGSSSAGLDALYEWIKYNVLTRVQSVNYLRKKHFAQVHARSLNGKKSVPDKVYETVCKLVKPFKPDEEFEELQKEYNNINRRYKNELATIDHLQELFEWAMDNTSLSSMKRYLADLES